LRPNLDNPDNSKIDEELVCIDSIVCNLYEKHNSIMCIEREINDPPDFWLTISGEKFATEVTSIVDGVDYDARCIRLRDIINNKCQETKQLLGLYALRVSGRPAIPNYRSKQWVDLVRKAIEYVVSTSVKNSDEEHCLSIDEMGYIAIKKLSNRGASVELGGPVKLMWEGEAQVKLLELFGIALEKKRKVFTRKGMLHDFDRIIIIFYDAFGFCEFPEAKTVFNKYQNVEWLHSVYWAASSTYRKNVLFPRMPGSNGDFLFSKNHAWL
jgi:hypothetical protein